MESEDFEMKEKGLFETYEDDFFEYFENYKFEHLLKKTEYLEKYEKIKIIKEKYPNVRMFIEEYKIVDFTEDDKKKILELLDLQMELHILDEKALFKLGFKEALKIMTESV